MDGTDTGEAILQRAKSYLLVSAVVTNILTFAIGPKLIAGGDDDEPKDDVDLEFNPRNIHGNTTQEQEAEDDESAPLLPKDSKAQKMPDIPKEEAENMWQKFWKKLPEPVQKTLSFLGIFVNATAIGALLGGKSKSFSNFSGWITAPHYMMLHYIMSYHNPILENL